MKNYIGGAATIELTGNRMAVVDGSDGIIDYNSEEIIVKMGKLTVRFLGHSLKLKKLTENSAVIEGFIKSVEYTY